MLEATFIPDQDLARRATAVVTRRSFAEQAGYPRESRIRWFLRHAIAILIGGLLMVLLIAAVTTGDMIRPWQVMVVALVAYVSGAYGAAFLGERKDWRFLSNLLSSKHPLTYSLAADGIHMELNMGRSFVPWASVSQVLLSDEFVLLMREESVLYVPTAAFPDEPSLLAFTAYASARVREAGQPVDGAPAA